MENSTGSVSSSCSGDAASNLAGAGQEDGPLLCPICDKPFTLKKSVYPHIRKIHKMNLVIGGKLKCPLCSHNPRNYSRLRDHIRIEHGQHLEKEILSFPSLEKFFEWKTTFQQETNYRYVRYTTARRTTKFVKSYFICHRSGFYTSRGTGQKKLKKQGSNKMNCTCPSTLDVTENRASGSVTAVFWKTHVGHTADFGHTNLTNEDRALIAGKIMQGMTFDGILEEIHDPSKGEELKRLHFLTRRDLHNIKRALDKAHETSAASILAWVQEMSELGEKSPVVYYKEAGEVDPEGVLDVNDTLLVVMTEFQRLFLTKFGAEKICIDGGHFSSTYSFELLTLLCMKDNGEGYPIAFCIMGQISTSSVVQFFAKVKQRSPTIKCRVFMCADCPDYYAAWCDVMGTPEKHLICTWQLEKNWQKQLSTLSLTSEREDAILKALKGLLSEQNHERLEGLMNSFATDLLKDASSREFLSYFQENYADQVSAWASCYRLQWDMDADNHSDRFHKTVEQIYSEAKKSKRLDTCLNILITLSRDKMFEWLIRASKKVQSKLMQEIRCAHQRSKLVDINRINLAKDNTWEVSLSDNADKKYIVTFLEGKCSCNLRCSVCDICIHACSCTCPDHLLRFNVCEHIHACWVKNAVLNGTYLCEGEELDPMHTSDDEDDAEESDFVDPFESITKNDRLKALKKRLEMLLGFTLSITDEDITGVNKYLDLAIDELKQNANQTAAMPSGQIVNGLNANSGQTVFIPAASNGVVPTLQVLPQIPQTFYICISKPP